MMRVIIALIACLSLGSCGGGAGARFSLIGDETGAPVRIALLLPLEGGEEKWREASRDMLAAAEQALFDLNQPRLVLLVKNSGGDAGMAGAAAREALAEGAAMIIGPVLAAELAGVREAVGGEVPVLALSGNRQAGAGLFLLGFSPEQEITRIITYAAEAGAVPLAGFLPRSPYGRLARQVMVQTALAEGVAIEALETYPADIEAAIPAARRLADYRRRADRLTKARSALEHSADWLGAPVRLTPMRGRRSATPLALPVLPPEEAKAQLELIREARTRGDLPYRAIFLPEGGDLLRAVAQLLPFFEIPPDAVRLLGTGLWDDPELVRERALAGGWFAAPGASDSPRSARLADRARIASLAYDAVLLVGAAVRETGDAPSPAFLRRREGFVGVDGLLRFTAEGFAERGLGVREVAHDHTAIISEPALP